MHTTIEYNFDARLPTFDFRFIRAPKLTSVSLKQTRAGCDDSHYTANNGELYQTRKKNIFFPKKKKSSFRLLEKKVVTQ